MGILEKEKEAWQEIIFVKVIFLFNQVHEVFMHAVFLSYRTGTLKKLMPSVRIY